MNQPLLTELRLLKQGQQTIEQAAEAIEKLIPRINVHELKTDLLGQYIEVAGLRFYLEDTRGRR